MTWNINGWTPNNRILRETIIAHLKPDILCLCETHLEKEETIQLEGYHFVPFNRKLRHVNAPKIHGGVGILIKDELYNIYSIVTVDKTIDGLLGVKFTDKETQHDFVVFACYLAPDNSPYGRNQTEFLGHLITQLYIHNECDQIFICGDFNGRIGELADCIEGIDNLPKRHVLDKTVQGHGEALIGFMNDAKLCALNGRLCPDNDDYTCISGKGLSVVDYIMVPHDVFEKCRYFKVHTMSDLAETCSIAQYIGCRCRLPDHSILHVKFDVKEARDVQHVFENKSMENSVNNNGHRCPVFNKRKYRFENVPNLFLSSESWKYSMNQLIDLFLTCRNNQNEIDNIYTKFCKSLTNEMNNYLRYTDSSKAVRKRYKNKKPYWNEDLNSLWVEMRDAEKKYTKCKGNKHVKDCLRKTFVEKRNHFDKSLRQAERQYKRNVLIEIDDVCTSNPREFWNHISKLGPRQNAAVPLKVYDENGIVNTDIEFVLNKWKQDFDTLYKCPSNIDSDFNDDFFKEIKSQKNRWEAQMEEPDYECNPELNNPLSFDEIERMVNRLKQRKSTGIDEIPNEVLKNHDVMLLLYYLFVKCFECCIIPSLWLRAIIVPVPKSVTKDPYVPLNYRGISILSCVCKVFSGIINKRIANYCELGDLFVDEQNGFREKRACVDHIFSLTSIIRNRFAESKDTFACFIDMQKAFDWVDRDMLFYKLLSYNIDGKIYKCIKSLYNHPLSCIKVNSYTTDWFETENGVRQGDSLSPTLFAIFINDLAKEINNLNIGIPAGDRKVSILLFADDIVILGENEPDLQTLLSFVNAWCKNWRLKINMDKTKIVHYRKKRKRKTQFTFMLNEQIEIVNTYKYLGIYLDEHLDFNKTGDILAGAAGRALGSIISKFKTFRNVGFKTYEKLYYNGVVPILDYCSGVWGYGKLECSSKIQHRALRYYLGVHQKTPILALEGDTGWLSCTVRRHIEMIRLWNRLVNMDDSRLTKRIFMWDYNQCKNNWCQEMEQLCNDIEDNFFIQKITCNIDNYQQKCMEKWADTWRENLSTKPKLRTYKLFKNEYHTEDFVKYCYSRPKRSLLAQLRSGVLPLHIETGRFRNLKPEERLCSLCNSNEIEDEVHFVCKCTALTDLREELYGQVENRIENFTDLNDNDKFVHLVKLEWRPLCSYIEKAWNVRTSLMYMY